MPAFRSTTDIPLIARRSALSREEARRRLGLPLERPLVLLSFGGLGFTGIDVSGLAELSEIEFVATESFADPPANLVCLERPELDYTLLLRACDAVVTKPGYGIVAASLVNGVRVLYTTRDDFPETPILVRALEEHATAQVVPLADLAQGALGGPLEALLARPVVESGLAADGAQRAAEMLAREIGC
jgi:UDP:flavonoid glycosyltransferase YjiC (YdhE family)